jgi:hypothetical protein
MEDVSADVDDPPAEALILKLEAFFTVAPTSTSDLCYGFTWLPGYSFQMGSGNLVVICETALPFYSIRARRYSCQHL